MTATPSGSPARLEASDVGKDLHALLDADLYLLKAWLADPKRRLRRLWRSGIRLSEPSKCFKFLGLWCYETISKPDLAPSGWGPGSCRN